MAMRRTSSVPSAARRLLRSSERSGHRFGFPYRVARRPVRLDSETVPESKPNWAPRRLWGIKTVPQSLRCLCSRLAALGTLEVRLIAIQVGDGVSRRAVRVFEHNACIAARRCGGAIG